MLEQSLLTDLEEQRPTVTHQTFAGLSARTAASMLGLSVRQILRLEAGCLPEVPAESCIAALLVVYRITAPARATPRREVCPSPRFPGSWQLH